jgi:hypothetical protein
MYSFPQLFAVSIGVQGFPGAVRRVHSTQRETVELTKTELVRG